MATLAGYDHPSHGFVSEEEYLSTSYEPDCDYVDGRLVERNLGELERSLLQSLLVHLFMNNRAAWSVYPAPEWRNKVRPGNYRIPDVTVLRAGSPREPVATNPPLLVIEILSPEDRLNAMIKRCQDYVQFGIPNIWILDPQRRCAYRLTPQGAELIESGVLLVPETPIRIVLSDLFAELDSI
jgi:Uma2 family endonuclease